MSFLDNLESNLKSMESREERGEEDHRKRESDRAQALAAAPWADKLKNSAYTKDLMTAATRAGYKSRCKVYMAWIGSTLKLEAREQKLELVPTAQEHRSGGESGRTGRRVARGAGLSSRGSGTEVPRTGDKKRSPVPREACETSSPSEERAATLRRRLLLG